MTDKNTNKPGKRDTEDSQQHFEQLPEDKKEGLRLKKESEENDGRAGLEVRKKVEKKVEGKD